MELSRHRRPVSHLFPIRRRTIVSYLSLKSRYWWLPGARSNETQDGRTLQCGCLQGRAGPRLEGDETVRKLTWLARDQAQDVVEWRRWRLWLVWRSRASCWEDHDDGLCAFQALGWVAMQDGYATSMAMQTEQSTSAWPWLAWEGFKNYILVSSCFFSLSQVHVH